MTDQNFGRVWIVALAIISALVTAYFLLPIFFDKTLHNVDQDTHFRWIFQFSEMVAKGEPYPRWMFLANSGLGEVGYSAYLLYWYLAYLVSVLTGDIWTAVKTLALLSAVASGMIAFLFWRSSISYRHAIATGVLVSLAPFSLFLFTHYAAYPWHFSLVFVVALIGVTVTAQASRARFFAIALLVALLTLAHSLVAFMALVCLAPAALYVEQGNLHERFRRFAVNFGVPALLGVGLVAFNLMPAISARALLNPETASNSLYLDWHNSFAFPVITAQIYGTRWTSVQWIHPLFIACNLGLVAVGLIFSGKEQRNVRRMTYAFSVVTIVGLLMASEAAYLVYEYIPLIRNVQWPYRFVSIAAISSVFAVGAAAFLDLPEKRRFLRAPRMAASVLPTLFFSALLQMQVNEEGQDVRSSEELMKGIFHQPGLELATQGPNWKAYVEKGGFGEFCKRNGARCVIIRDSGRLREWKVEAENRVELALPSFYFPGWTTYIDHEEVPHSIDLETGLVSLRVPGGSHTVGLEFSGLPSERTGRIVSGISAFLLILSLRLWPNIAPRHTR